METRTDTLICFLTVYAKGRAYGGPEEGGWYYDTFEHICSVPFMASVEFEARVFDYADPNCHVDEMRQKWQNDQGDLCWWEPTRIAIVNDEWSGASWMDGETRRLMNLYDIDAPGMESSKWTRAADASYCIAVEHAAGERARRPRMRYC